MHHALTAAALVLLLVACATDQAAGPPAAGPPASDRRVVFLCSNGENVEMRFFPQQGVGVLVRGGRTQELQQQPAASGFLYVGGGTTVRGQGDELRIEAAAQPPLRCRAR